MLLAYERAERSTDPDERNRLLTFVVVGGGPTGAELAGAMAEIAKHSLAKDFDRIDPRQARIYLLEAGPRIMPAFPERLSAKAMGFLQSLGVTVRTGALVTAVDAEGVTLHGEERIWARTVLWAAGVTAAPIARSLGVELDRAGRVPIQLDLSLPGHPEVLVIGDLASLAGADGKPLPGVAPVAIQQGRHAAANIRRMLAGGRPEPFVYRNRGNMAVIGRNRGIAVVGPLRLAGFLAWAAWLLVHIVYLIGFRNRLLVLTQWAWSYVTFQAGARLITDAPPEAASHRNG
jgi:NADH dehydrogenase